MVHREPKNGSNGVYYVQNFDTILICGHTELQAQIRWTENVRQVPVDHKTRDAYRWRVFIA